jgi:hypothetical protein
MADLLNAIADIRIDVREVKATNAMILGMIGEMVKDTARADLP